MFQGLKSRKPKSADESVRKSENGPPSSLQPITYLGGWISAALQHEIVLMVESTREILDSK